LGIRITGKAHKGKREKEKRKNRSGGRNGKTLKKS